MLPTLPRGALYLFILISGLAALSWEVVWQLKATLALGASAWGTALTLAVTMGGMCVGSLTVGHILHNRTIQSPLRIYGILEIVIGLSGLLLSPLFKIIEAADTSLYAELQNTATSLHILGIVLTLGLPTFCMGATLPVLGLAARQYRTSIATLYGLNTLGAAAGALLAAFALIPLLGVTHASWVIAAINILVGISSFIFAPRTELEVYTPPQQPAAQPLSPLIAALSVFATGYATFSLEVAWFRSLTAAFQSTTDAFAIMLSAVLLALGAGAQLVPLIRQKNISAGLIMAAAGVLIFISTPIIERFDLMTATTSEDPALLIVNWFLGTLLVAGTPILLLGIALPRILDSRTSSQSWGGLYALNAVAAIIGAIATGWVLLPLIGFARTSWLAGALILTLGLLMSPAHRRASIAVIGIIAFALAITFETGVSRTRTQGWLFSHSFKPSRVLEAHEGPNATVSAVEYDNGGRALIIDGFVAAAQFSEAGQPLSSVHYMDWMGHLPMLLHSKPENALVICFGTGQTANAVRQENPVALDIVDLNPQVPKLGHYFSENENVLDDPRVKMTIMDGRAYIRRTNKTYDTITLEPMPPVFAGVNSLYSQEFYQFARAKLSPNGTIAQWVPFHLIDPEYAASIAKTFQGVFPNSIMWLDPGSKTGILLGSMNEEIELGKVWPGFKRAGIKRDLSQAEVRKGVLLNKEQLISYGEYGRVISDDNQLLSYGRAVYLQHHTSNSQQDNMDMIDGLLKAKP